MTAQTAPPAPVRLVALGLACCGLEVSAAVRAHGLVVLDGADPGLAEAAGRPAALTVLVVAGTVTDAMAPAIRECYDRVPEPKRVIAFGACADSGGPYWDSWCVTQGAERVVPVDRFVPGCPPRPQALIAALVDLQARLPTQTPGGRPATEPDRSGAAAQGRS